jgi:N6-adenosine-specific RNA methylase IME4
MTHDEPEPSRRLSRRKTNSKYGANYQSQQNVPSAVHYVGYVEEDETPEMIMAKFQELEEIQRKASAERERTEKDCTDQSVSDQGCLEEVAREDQHQLTDEQLLQVFKQTSMFNVRTALQDNAVLAGIDELLELTNDRYGDDDIISDDEDMLRSFWSDDEDWDDSRRRRKGDRRGGKKSRRAPGMGAPKVRHRIVTAYNPMTQALVRKKVKVADPNEIQYIRVPNPLPLSWGRTIAPYSKKLAGEEKHRGLEEIESTGNESNVVAEAVLVNAAWYKGCNLDRALKRISAVAFEKIVPYGFVFVWTPKELVHSVCKLMQKKGFAYIENLTWVWMEPNNTITESDSEYIRRSHLTLYMFRAVAADRAKIELRHQRSPDVIFDYRKDGDRCPQETYEYLETLLPQSTAEGKLVEMFGKKSDNLRPGWKVVEYALS